MIELFKAGGPLFMSILTLEALLMLAAAFVVTLPVLKGAAPQKEKIDFIKSLGLLAFVTGIFSQAISLYLAFDAISQVEGVSPAMLAGGLKVSMITTIYGFIIYLIALLMTLGLQSKLSFKDAA